MSLYNLWVNIQHHVGVVPDGDPGIKTATAICVELGLAKDGTKQQQKGQVPRWLAKARSYLGLHEIKGPKHHRTILSWWERIKLGWINDDETPWCAAFVGGVLEECGIRSTRKANARSYLNWGVELSRPVTGCVVVFWRGSRDGWKGHVAFLEGISEDGNPVVVGGNQSDAVSKRTFQSSRVLGYRWPEGEPLPSGNEGAVLVSASGGFSTNEA